MILFRCNSGGQNARLLTEMSDVRIIPPEPLNVGRSFSARTEGSGPSYGSWILSRPAEFVSQSSNGRTSPFGGGCLGSNPSCETSFAGIA